MLEKTRNTRQRLIALAITLVMMLGISIPAFGDEGYTDGSEVAAGNVDVIEGTYEVINLDDIDLDGEFAMPTVPVLPDAPPVDGSESDDNPIVEDDVTEGIENLISEDDGYEAIVVAYVSIIPTYIGIDPFAAITEVQVERYGTGDIRVGQTVRFYATICPDYGIGVINWWVGVPMGHFSPGTNVLDLVTAGFPDPNNRLVFEITFHEAGPWHVTAVVGGAIEYLDPNAVQHRIQTPVLPRQQTGGNFVTTPTHHTPARISSGGGSSPASQPGGSSFNLNSGMGASTRVVANIRNTVSNATTADDIMNAIRAVLPEGVTAEWSQFNSFNLVPATADTGGLITGFITISAGSGANRTSTGLRINWVIPRLS